MPLSSTLANELLITTQLPFVTETTLDQDLVFVRIDPDLIQDLREIPSWLFFSKIGFTASQVRSAFIEHIVEWLERQPGSEELARTARLMSRETS